MPAARVQIRTCSIFRTNAMLQGAPDQGTADREDGWQELYRAAFIRLSIDAKRLQRLALGAFNCRVTERQA